MIFFDVEDGRPMRFFASDKCTCSFSLVVLSLGGDFPSLTSSVSAWYTGPIGVVFTLLICVICVVFTLIGILDGGENVDDILRGGRRKACICLLRLHNETFIHKSFEGGDNGFSR